MEGSKGKYEGGLSHGGVQRETVRGGLSHGGSQRETVRGSEPWRVQRETVRGVCAMEGPRGKHRGMGLCHGGAQREI